MNVAGRGSGQLQDLHVSRLGVAEGRSGQVQDLALTFLERAADNLTDFPLLLEQQVSLSPSLSIYLFSVCVIEREGGHRGMSHSSKWSVMGGEGQGGIDALESMVYSSSARADLAARAAAMVDRFFGDPGPDG